MARKNGLSRGMYDSRLSEHVDHVVAEAREVTDTDSAKGPWFEAVATCASDSLDGDAWFTRPGDYGPAYHGHLIQYALDDDIDLRYSDIEIAYGDDPAAMVKKLAYLLVQSAIIERAMDKGPGK